MDIHQRNPTHQNMDQELMVMVQKSWLSDKSSQSERIEEGCPQICQLSQDNSSGIRHTKTINTKGMKLTSGQALNIKSIIQSVARNRFRTKSTSRLQDTLSHPIKASS